MTSQTQTDQPIVPWKTVQGDIRRARQFQSWQLPRLFVGRARSGDEK